MFYSIFIHKLSCTNAFWHFPQANTNAEIITPIRTANAKLCQIVINATKTPTNICFRHFVDNFRLIHSKSTDSYHHHYPVKAAIGNASMIGEAKRIIDRIVKPPRCPKVLHVRQQKYLLTFEQSSDSHPCQRKAVKDSGALS